MTTIPFTATELEAANRLRDSEIDALAQLAAISEETIACIENLTDTAFWQLMLSDDLENAGRDVDLLCASIRFRWGQVLASITHPELDIRIP